MGLNRQQKRAAERTAAKKLRKEELKESGQAVRAEGAALLKRVGLMEEQLKNINSWAMGAIRDQQEQGARLDMVSTVAALLIKEALGRNLSEEEVAALTEALDGPPKKEGDNGETSQSTQSDAAPAAGDDVRSELGTEG